MQREDIRMLVKKWWDIYNDSSLDYNKNLSGSGEVQTNGFEIEPFVQALSEVGRVQYVTAPSAA